MCINIVEIWFWITDGQILSIFDRVTYNMSIYSFWIIILENINGFSPNLICAMILWRSEFELLTGKFHQFLTELSTCDRSVFSFPDDNLSMDFHETWFVHQYCGNLV